MSFFKKLGQAIGSAINTAAEKGEGTNRDDPRQQTAARITQMLSGNSDREDQMPKQTKSEVAPFPWEKHVLDDFPRRFRERDFGEPLLNQLLEETLQNPEARANRDAALEEQYPVVRSILQCPPRDQAPIFARACWIETEMQDRWSRHMPEGRSHEDVVGVTKLEFHAFWVNVKRLVCLIGDNIDDFSEDQALQILFCLMGKHQGASGYRFGYWRDQEYKFYSEDYLETLIKVLGLLAKGQNTPTLRRAAFALLDALIKSDYYGAWHAELCQRLFPMVSERDVKGNADMVRFRKLFETASGLADEMTHGPSPALNGFIQNLLETRLHAYPLGDDDFARYRVFDDVSPNERTEILVQAILIRNKISGILNGPTRPDHYRHADDKFELDCHIDTRGLMSYLRHVVKISQNRALNLSDEHIELLFDQDLHWGTHGINLQILRAIGKSMKQGERPRAISAARRFLERHHEETIAVNVGKNKDLQKIRNVMGPERAESKANKQAKPAPAPSRAPADMSRDANIQIEKIFPLVREPTPQDFQNYYEESVFGPKHMDQSKPKRSLGAAVAGLFKSGQGDQDSSEGARVFAMLGYSAHNQSRIVGAELEAEKFAKTFHESPHWVDATVARMEALIDAARQSSSDNINKRVVKLLEGYRFFRNQDNQYSLAWEALEKHADEIEDKPKPTRQWLKDAAELTSLLDKAKLSRLLKSHLRTRYTGKPSFGRRETSEGIRLRGLIYMASAWPHEDLAPALTEFAQKDCFNNRLHREKIGNAVLWYLQNLPAGAGLPYLARLLSRVKYPKVRKRIDGILNEVADKAGVARGALDEITVPVYDFDKDGRAELPVGKGAALLRISGTSTIELTWRTPEGKTVKSQPKAFTEDDETRYVINEIKREIKEIKQDLSIQPARLQRLHLDDRIWTAADWIEHYADHPLISQMSRRLIWNAHKGETRVSGLWRDGAFQDIDGNPVDLDGAEVTLWHPLHDPAEGLAWRDRLAELEIVQPFRQAHREVYVVTGAERRTNTYSNRFAGHILKQSQMIALARINDWKITQRVAFDTPNDQPTHRVIRAHGLIAEYWTEGAGDSELDVTEGGGYLYLSTDQVRFYRIDPKGKTKGTGYDAPRGEAVAMEDVPAIVFSEIMRQVDLFVGVSSIANDPLWGDAGAEAEHPSQWGRSTARDYWERQSFGDLTETADTRKELLESLLPVLAIGKQCSIDGNYLRVQGKRRTYRIHLGSSNIMMEPDSQYLCIVPAQTRPGEAGAGRVHLPFEGDTTLSLILSKAFLLAADDKITDPVILNQINR